MTTNQEAKLYAKRDKCAQRDYYTRHVDAMTGEGLHAKGDIAAELAHRDIEIDRLKTICSAAYCALLRGISDNELMALLDGAFSPTGAPTLAIQSRDCRICARFVTASGGCASTVQCVDASQFRPTAPRQYWLISDSAPEAKE